MGKTAIVTGGTKKDVSAMGVLALNIKEIAPDLADELIIYHDGISRKEQKIIQNIFPTRFCEYQFPIDFISRRKNSSLRYFSSMIFCKYECFKLLEEYDRVIWTDYDVLIRRNLKELLASDAGLQIVEDNEALQTMFLPDIKVEDFTEYDLQKNGVCTPLFVMTPQIGDYRQFYNWCIEKTRQYAPYIYYPEQCILSMLVQKFQISYDNLSREKYALHPRDDDGEASIIHAYGRPKFWEGLYNEKWAEYYQEWLTLGGSRYRQPLKEKLIQLKVRITDRNKK